MTTAPDLRRYMTETVRLLVKQCIKEGIVVSPTLPYLADALEDAGYSNESVLHYLRTRQGKPPDDLWLFEDASKGIPPELVGWDWEQSFAYAGEDVKGADGSASIKPADPRQSDSDVSPFSRWDVAEVLGTSEGVNDGPNWLCYGRLKDGRYFFLTAGCDYTGWG